MTKEYEMELERHEDESVAERQEEQSGEEQRERDEPEGVLVGTSTEEAPGVGGVGDHPAPAVMRDPETGEIHSAGQPAGAAPEASPLGDQADESAGDVVSDPEARERLNEVTEPEPHPISRPDIGTE